MLYSHFDQFEIIRIIPLHPFGNLDISITNATVFMFLSIGFFYFIYITNIEEGLLVPGRWQSIIEMLYEVVHDMVKDNIGSEGSRFFPFIFTLFVFIGLMNIFGIVPYTFTPTSHIIVTFGLSLSIFFGCTFLGLINFRSDFFAMFLPAGSPLVLGPFLILIEFVSYTAKAISLGVRLAANITAGHLLFSILSGFAWQMLLGGPIFMILSLFPMAIVLCITVLEMAVALIQAYVFCLLTTIYLNDSIHLH